MGMGGTLAVAAAGWTFAYWNSKAQEERKARIERVNEQLREFYGPLLACVFATQSAYNAMVRQHSGGDARAFQHACAADAHGPEASAYRLWVEKVLQPLNERAAAVIAERIDLLDANQVVPELLQLVAHVSAMRVIISRWQQGELAAGSAISYPDTLQQWMFAEYSRIKWRQARLLGFKPSSRAGAPLAPALPQAKL